MSTRNLLALAGLGIALAGCSVFQSKPEAPATGPLPEPDIPYTRFVLDNGLRLIVHEDRKAPLVTVNIWYHVGSKDEQPGRTGLAHLFEHLMFNGSEHHNEEWFPALEAVGATGMNGTTNADRTNYYATVPTPALDRLLWMESDRMGHLLGVVDQDKLDEQRGVVKNEKRQGENRPYGRVWNSIPSNSYPAGHPYSWTTIGSMEDLDAASLDDVHDWFRQYYGAANAVIVIAGDISPEVALEKVQHYFGDIPPGPSLSRPSIWPAPIPDERRIELEDRVPHARVHLVWNIPPDYTRELSALSLASDILGGGKTSRLYERLVYRDQIATNAGVFVLPRQLGSQFIMYATAKPETDPADLEAALLEEMQRLRDKGPTAAELERVRTGIYAKILRGLERIGGLGGKADILARAEVIAGDADAFRTDLRWLREITPAEIRDASQKWLGDGRLVLTVTPENPGKPSGTDADRSRLPDVENPPELSLPPLQRATLSNGLRVVLAERHNAPVVEFRWLADAGYSADPPQLSGLASLTMAMLDEGAGERDALTLAADLEALGAQIGASARLDTCTISLSAVTPMLEPALDIYADVIRAPRFPDEELARLKPLTLAAIDQEQADPFRLALRVLPPLMYGVGHPYGVPFTGTGTRVSVDAITRDDVADFHARWIQPDNSQLLVVGDIDLATLVPLLEARFGDWNPLISAGQKFRTPPRETDAPRIYLLDRPDASQSVVLAGMLAPELGDEDNIAMVTANTILGGMFGSRLNLNLREDKRWSYGASSSLVTTKAERPLIAYSRIERDYTAPAMREIVREFVDLQRARPPRGSELETAKRSLTLSLPGRNETASQLAGSYSRIVEHGLPDDYYNRYVGEVMALDAGDVSAGASRMINPNRAVWVVVGDLDVIERPIRKLGIGEIIVLGGGE